MEKWGNNGWNLMFLTVVLQEKDWKQEVSFIVWWHWNYEHPHVFAVSRKFHVFRSLFRKKSSRKPTIFDKFLMKLCMEMRTGIHGHKLANTCNHLLDLNTLKEFPFSPTYWIFDFEENVSFQLSLNLKFVQLLPCPFLKDTYCSIEVWIKLKTEIDRDLLLFHVISKQKIQACLPLYLALVSILVCF